MSDGEDSDPGDAGAALSVEMLKAVIEGTTYDAVGVRFGLSRTAVERRIKRVAFLLSRTVGIQGMNDESVAFVRRLRQHRAAVTMALTSFEPPTPQGPRPPRVLSSEEIARAMRRIKARSNRPWHDQALFCILFATGARPLEIARLEVRDYLQADGNVKRESELRSEVALAEKPRPLYFESAKLDELLAPYLQERLSSRLGLGDPELFRGLDPCSRLFLSPKGEGFRVTPYGCAGQRRFLCSEILDTYRRLFRHSELEDITALSARRTVAARLCERGADEAQVGLLLGISQRAAVRELMQTRKPTIAELVGDLV